MVSINVAELAYGSFSQYEVILRLKFCEKTVLELSTLQNSFQKIQVIFKISANISTQTKPIYIVHLTTMLISF